MSRAASSAEVVEAYGRQVTEQGMQHGGFGTCPCCGCRCDACHVLGHTEGNGCCSKGCNSPGKK